MAQKGNWVRIHQVVLTPDARAPQVPEDTAKVPLELWVKGELLQDADTGDTVQVRTRAGRVVAGTLLAGEVDYTHTFGKTMPELRLVGDMVRNRLREVRHEG